MSGAKDNEYGAMGKLQRPETGKRKIKNAYSLRDTSLDLWKGSGLHDPKERERVKHP